MNKHIRLVVSVLFAVIILLAVGLTRSYVDVSQDTGDNGEITEIVRKLNIDENGNRIFEGDGGLYGIVDSNDRVIVAPEWIELDFASDGVCVASKRIGGRLLTGCIDYEGNITLPFIYRNINKHVFDSFVFYTAEADSDRSCVVYDEHFTPCFMRSWDSCDISGNEMILTEGENIFTYSCGESGFVCTRADISGEALEKAYQINIYSRVLLSKLDCSALEKISKGVTDYLEYAFTGEPSALSRLAGEENHSSFTVIFPEDDKIISRRLVEISDIFIFTEKSETGTDFYAVSIIADTEIGYIDENGKSQRMRDEYKAILRFIPSVSGITAVSGGFVKPEPDYPVPVQESTTAPAAENNSTQDTAEEINENITVQS